MTKQPFTRDPAVVAWQIAMAPQPRPASLGVHWWREAVTNHHTHAREAWERRREQCEDNGGAMRMEPEEYRRAYPPPTLRDAMVGLAQGRFSPSGWGLGI